MLIMPLVTDDLDSDGLDEQARARAAHLTAKAVLEKVRATWTTDSETSELPSSIHAAAPDDAVEGLSCLYVFAARIGGRAVEDPAVARQWLNGWSAARARVPDDGRAALDAGIAFGARLHQAMGIEEDPAK